MAASTLLWLLKFSPFFVWTFGLHYANISTSWCRHVGACLNEPLWERGRILTLIKLNFFGFETCLYKSQFRDLIYTQSACNTPKRKENLKSHHMIPLKEQFTKKCTFAHPHSIRCWWVFFIGSDLEKCSIASLARQWILWSEWVPSEWETKQLIKTSIIQK